MIDRQLYRWLDRLRLDRQLYSIPVSVTSGSGHAPSTNPVHEVYVCVMSGVYYAHQCHSMHNACAWGMHGTNAGSIGMHVPGVRMEQSGGMRVADLG